MRTAAASLLSRVPPLTRLGRIYDVASAGDVGRPFSSRALEALDVGMVLPHSDAGRIPARGPLVVVANHPLGALDGLLVLDAIGRSRRDVKLLGNRWLHVIPELREHLLPVDVFGGRPAVRRNSLALRAALKWLAQGGCVAVFPAGEVAHTTTADGRVIDSVWQSTAGDLAARAGAAVLPVFIEGHNSRLFRAAGRLHPLLRTALLPHELLRQRGSRVTVRVGEAIPAVTVRDQSEAADRAALLRGAVDVLAPPVASGVTLSAPVAPPLPVAERGDGAAIAADVRTLGAPLLESGRYQVFCARARELPAVLPELGRLRELAFRAVGEGTGRPRDLDGFDDVYHHLFVWDRECGEIAGAYRLGATDEILEQSGVHGLYTRTLFDYGPELMAQLGPALELGRSFVAPAYQRDFSPLLLLWKGISRFVVQNPRYRRLFGVVSISDDYDSTSRRLMIEFLQTTRFDADLGRLVKAKNPPPPARPVVAGGTAVERLDQVSALIRGIEPDGKDMPILLRQYLKLNARLLGFTLDAAFGNVLDGLVVVDLDDVDPAILARYMGRDEAEAFRAQSFESAGNMVSS